MTSLYITQREIMETSQYFYYIETFCVLGHFVKVDMYQVQYKLFHSKYYQISLRMIASCSIMRILPIDQI